MRRLSEKIEVEVENLDMVKEAVEAGADIIMLDNMSPEDMKKSSGVDRRKSPDRVLRKCDKRKYRHDPRHRRRLCFQRCTDAFCTDS